MEHTNCSTSGQLPIFWDRFHHEKWLVDLACRKEEGEAQGAIHKGRPQNFRDFWPPPPLVRILIRPVRVNPRNLPYYICFWATPLPPSRCGRPLCMAPKDACRKNSMALLLHCDIETCHSWAARSFFTKPISPRLLLWCKHWYQYIRVFIIFRSPGSIPGRGKNFSVPLSAVLPSSLPDDTWEVQTGSD